MSEEKILGRGIWLDKVASELINREKKLGRSLKLLRVESGLGASGIPHVGSIGDAIRAYGVMLALKNFGYQSELIAYSDDMDGIRKVPEGLPSWLSDYLAFPVSTIPDPFDCHSSYGAHMSSILTDGLDKLNIPYKFQSGTDAYKKGLLTNQIITILEHSQLIGKKIGEMLGQTKFENVLPYYPICPSCKKLYVAEANSYDASTKKVMYKCCGSEVGKKKIAGCGAEGEVDVTAGNGKLSWKSEFAARWAAFDIRFEAYGKDIADSVKVNDWISDEILKHPPPHHVVYEMFLDKSGKKISKSLGNVFTPQAWLTYGSPYSLFLLMFKRIAGTRNLSVEDIPTYMDEYDSIEDIYFGKIKETNPAKLRKIKGLYEYIHQLDPPNKSSIHAPYLLIAQLVSVAPAGNSLEYIIDKLKKYRTINDVDEQIIEKINLATKWAESFQVNDNIKVNLDPIEKKALSEIISLLEKNPDPDMIQNQIFESAKTNNIPPNQLFNKLYNILIGTNRGPRLGPYIFDTGVKRAVKVLKNQL